MSDVNTKTSEQRRRYFRVKLAPSAPLSVRVWKLPPGATLAQRPMPSQEVKLVLWEIGAGGLSVTLPKADDPRRSVRLDDRLRVEIVYRDTSLLLEAKPREPHLKSQDGSMWTGLEFKIRDTDIEGRRKISQLNRIVGDLQRADISARQQELKAG